MKGESVWLKKKKKEEKSIELGQNERKKKGTLNGIKFLRLVGLLPLFYLHDNPIFILSDFVFFLTYEALAGKSERIRPFSISPFLFECWA